MIKEIFDIEPKQKNAIMCLLGTSSISFLQIYLFKKEILEKSSLEIIGICLALTVCWSILNLLPLYSYFQYYVDDDSEKYSMIDFEKVILTLGLLMLIWITLLTYIAYELQLCFKNFIRLSIIISIIRSLFWIIRGIIKETKKEVKQTR